MSNNKLSLELEVKANQVIQVFDYLNNELNKMREFLGKPLNVDADASALKQELLDAGAAIEGLPDGDVVVSGDASEAVDASEEAQGAVEQIPDNKHVDITSDSGNLVADLGRIGLALNTVSMAYNKVQSVLGGYVIASHVQEKAELDLINSMKVKGIATQDNIALVMKLAGETQNLTTVGDEASMQLLSLATNMGISTDRMEEALHGAIGLTTAFASAGMSQETAMKGIALAFQGNFTQLQRYIPALQSATDETEKMAILQEAMANGFELSKAEVQSGSGAMAQYQNLVGDLKEKIGDFINQAITPLIKVLTKVVSFLNEYPGLASLLVAVMGTVATMIVFLTAKQVALNAAKAIGAALTGNWIALTAAAAVGVGIYAASTLSATGKQEDFNKALKISNQEMSKLNKSFSDQTDSFKNNVKNLTYDELGGLSEETEEKIKSLENAVKDFYETKKQNPDAELDSNVVEALAALKVQQGYITEEVETRKKAKKDKAGLESEYLAWKSEQDELATLEEKERIKAEIKNARSKYDALQVIDQETLDQKKALYNELLVLEEQFSTIEKAEAGKSKADELALEQKTLAEKRALLDSEKMSMIQYYANLQQLSAISYDKMKADFLAYLDEVKEAYGEESQEYKTTREELIQIQNAANMRLIQEKGSFASQIASLSRSGAEKELVSYENLMARLGELYKEDSDKYKEYQKAIKDAYVERTMESYENEKNNFDKQREAVDEYFATHRETLIANGVSETEIHEAKEEAKTRITEQELQSQLAINQQVATGLSGIFANLTKAVAGESEKSFKIRKTLSLVQATIDTFASANAAYKAMVTIPIVGPGLAIAAAAAAITAGMANVKSISQQKYEPPKAEKGGLLTGNSHARGGVIIEAEGGEYVTRKSRVAELGSGFFSFLNNGPLELVKGVLAGIQMPTMNIPAVPQVAYASGGQVSGGYQFGELLSEIRFLRRDLQEKEMSVNVGINANDVIKQADKVLLNESNIAGAVERGGFRV